MLKFLGVLPGDAGLPGAGEILDTTFDHTRQAKIALRSMMAHLYSDPESVPQTSAIMQTGRGAYIDVVTRHSSSEAGHVILAQALDACARGVIAEGSPPEARRRLMEGAVNLASALGFVAAYRSALGSDGRGLLRGYQSSFDFAKIAVPILFGALFVAFGFYTVWRFYREFDAALQVFSHVKPDVIERSLYPIANAAKQEQLNVGTTELARTSHAAFHMIPLIGLFFVTGLSIILVFLFVTASSHLDETRVLEQWFLIAEERRSSVLLLLVGTIATASSIPSGLDGLYETFIGAEFDVLQASRASLLSGIPGEGLAGITGFSAELDAFQYQDVCDDEPGSFYDWVKCLSLDRSMSMAAALFETLITTIDWTQTTGARYGLRDSVDFAQLVVLVDGKLDEVLRTFSHILLGLIEAGMSTVTRFIVIFAVLLIVFGGVTLLVWVPIHLALDRSIEAIRLLIRLLPPQDLLEDGALLNLIIGSNLDGAPEVLPASDIVLQHTTEAVISLSLDYTIDSVNESFHDVTGIPQDEAVGMGLRVIFPLPDHAAPAVPDSPADLYTRLEELKWGGVEDWSNVTSMVVTSTTEAGRQLHVDVMIVPHINSEHTLCSFSLLLRDLAKQSEGQQRSQMIKMRCEQVLRRLVPVEVHSRMTTAGMQSALFSSDSATVVSIRVLGIADCVTTHSPSRVLEFLATIYDAFDECADQYPSVRKVRCETDTILACSGLFDCQDEPAHQVGHAVFTCLAFLKRRGEISEKLGISVDVRCGIAFGGPLYGALLTMETPTFELIGEPVLQAVSICREADRNALHISEQTNALLSEGLFKVERAKPVGKKNRNAFVVALHEQ
jgi:class 3 adenylate cyclase/PAS domain-containing protein